VVDPALLVNAILGALPLHIVSAEGVAVIEGVGFIVMEAVTDEVQLLVVPIIV
jgi:hypothetical protein